VSAMVISISREGQMSTIQRACGSSVYVRQVDVVHDHGYLYRSGASTLGRGAQPSPQIVAGPPNLAVLLKYCGQLVVRIISTFDATRCQTLRLKCTKCTKFDLRWGSAPDQLGEVTALPRPLSCI